MTTNASPIRVMLVDDDDSFRDALAEELNQSGFHITTARSAEAALLEIETSGPDVAIVDLNLPGLSGQELRHEFKERLPSMELIVLTGHATVENAVRTLKDGVYDFLTKPCSLSKSRPSSAGPSRSDRWYGR